MNDTLRRAARDYSQEFFRAFHLLSNRKKALFILLGAFFLLGTGGVIYTINRAISIEIPAHAGELREGEVGVPRFINPVLATGDVDRDLTALIYSGLMRTSANGELIHDLAEGHTVSDDGLTYTFSLKKNLTWHDNTPLTSADIAYTIKRIQDPAIKSPLRPSWEGVGVETPDDTHVVFTLKHPYGPFLENTTLGILPRHIWEKIDTDSFALTTKNSEPIGSGPYEISHIDKNESGIPTKYTLSSFANFALGEPYISTLSLSFYANEEALALAYETGAVESVSTLAPETADRIAKAGATIRASSLPLPRIFAVFFNQNNARIFTDKSVRQALSLAVDRKTLISNVFRGYATSTNGPLPPGSLGADETSVEDGSIDGARAILEKNGWVRNSISGIYEKKASTKNEPPTELSFSLSTANTPELKKTADALVKNWHDLGAQVTLHLFEISDLNQNIIRPRKYDALLFGEIVGRSPDPFAFWHSSQRNDPGLNVALYANAKVDKILETARTTIDPAARTDLFRQFEKEVAADVPAVFLYAPSFIYATPTKLQGLSLVAVNSPADRFSMVSRWYVETDRVWKWFAPTESSFQSNN